MLHSLRTTPCRAPLFVFLEGCYYYEFVRQNSIYNQLLSCHCFLINVGQTSYSLFHKFFRYELFYQFLCVFGYLFDRACVVEFDMVFQGDPFGDHIPHNTVVGYTENKITEIRTFMLEWYDEVLPWIKQNYPSFKLDWNQPVINSGFVIGDVSALISYYHFLINHPFYQYARDEKPDTHDQLMVNIVYQNNEFQKNGINVIYLPYNKYYIPLCIEGRYILDDSGEWKLGHLSSNGSKGLVYHYWTENSNLKNNVETVCKKPTDYLY